jgi:hypothetical protein
MVGELPFSPFTCEAFVMIELTNGPALGFKVYLPIRCFRTILKGPVDPKVRGKLIKDYYDLQHPEKPIDDPDADNPSPDDPENWTFRYPGQYIMC